ncbi:hypothetical protein C8R47DRAFT_1072134 [Mycena vitilis]|nr:hypothetical protein C8R47DRAFT_1072134 [Mycena vitilis]
MSVEAGVKALSSKGGYFVCWAVGKLQLPEEQTRLGMQWHSTLRDLRLETVTVEAAAAGGRTLGVRLPRQMRDVGSKAVFCGGGPSLDSLQEVVRIVSLYTDPEARAKLEQNMKPRLNERTQVKSKILGWAPTSLLQLTKTSSGPMDTQSETVVLPEVTHDMFQAHVAYQQLYSIYDTNGVPESVLGATNTISRFEKRRQAAADASQPGLARLSCVYGPRVATRGPSGFVPTGRKLRLTSAHTTPAACFD